jgi:hypothetical protein
VINQKKEHAMEKHEIGKAFLADHPIGSFIDGEGLLEWWQLKVLQQQVLTGFTDDQRRKVISRVRRWINEAGQTLCLPQQQRFVIAVIDARRATYSVVSFVDHVLEMSATALDRSKRQALVALDRGLKEFRDVDLDALSDERRQQIEIGQRVLEVHRARMAEVYRDIERRRLPNSGDHRALTDNQPMRKPSSAASAAERLLQPASMLNANVKGSRK